MSDLPNPSDIIERIMQTAKAAMPENLGNDVKRNVRVAIQEVVADLDVVSRDEFEVQKSVLSKTRAKLDEMERIVAELEGKLSS